MRELLLTIHILSAAAWIGGGLFATFSYSSLAETVGLKRLGALDQTLGARFFGTAVVALVLSGVGLVLGSPAIGWGDAFVLIGIGVVIVDGILEGAIFGPRAKRITESQDPDMASWRRVLNQSSVAHMVLLVFAVWAMVANLGA